MPRSSRPDRPARQGQKTKRTAMSPAPSGALETNAAAWERLVGDHRSFGVLNTMDPIHRIGIVMEGVPAGALNDLAGAMGVTRNHLYQTMGVPRATMERKLRNKARLSSDESERLIGIARVIGQVEQIVQESGDPEGFDAAKWVADWLERPVPALGRRRPSSFMGSADGRELIYGLVDAFQSGVYW